MTFDQDPARWTASPEEAPELLRGAFQAARNEGPNPAQMRSLAFKIAAVSAGGAVAVGAAKATAAGNAAATAATWSIGKLAGVLAIAGSIAAGAAIWHQSNQPKEAPAKTTPAANVRAASPADEAPQPELVAPQPTLAAPAAAPAAAPVVSAPTANTPVAPQATSGEASPATAARLAPAGRSSESARNAQPTVNERVATASPQPRKATAAGQRSSDSGRDKPSISASSAAPRTISEVELLRSAQQALRARPREAFQLTEQHRQLYPTGEFAQERDALAIQALLRAGESEMARDLAVSFIKAHPSSPHAHRFREAMGIR